MITIALTITIFIILFFIYLDKYLTIKAKYYVVESYYIDDSNFDHTTN
jgi:hypothetical protein